MVVPIAVPDKIGMETNRLLSPSAAQALTGEGGTYGYSYLDVDRATIGPLQQTAQGRIGILGPIDGMIVPDGMRHNLSVPRGTRVTSDRMSSGD
jgi:hypothetical protein